MNTLPPVVETFPCASRRILTSQMRTSCLSVLMALAWYNWIDPGFPSE